jgi:hypothetical protein
MSTTTNTSNSRRSAHLSAKDAPTKTSKSELQCAPPCASGDVQRPQRRLHVAGRGSAKGRAYKTSSVADFDLRDRLILPDAPQTSRSYGTSSSSTEGCSWCGVPDAVFSCSTCHSVSYCSHECQCAHWRREHKGSCTVFERCAAATAVAAIAVDWKKGGGGRNRGPSGGTSPGRWGGGSPGGGSGGVLWNWGSPNGGSPSGRYRRPAPAAEPPAGPPESRHELLLALAQRPGFDIDRTLFARGTTRTC